MVVSILKFQIQTCFHLAYVAPIFLSLKQQCRSEIWLASSSSTKTRSIWICNLCQTHIKIDNTFFNWLLCVFELLRLLPIINSRNIISMSFFILCSTPMNFYSPFFAGKCNSDILHVNILSLNLFVLCNQK